MWRTYYKAKAVHDLLHIQVAVVGRPPVQLDQLDDPISKLDGLEEFLIIIQETLRSAIAVYLEYLNAFKPHPR